MKNLTELYKGQLWKARKTINAATDYGKAIHVKPGTLILVLEVLGDEKTELIKALYKDTVIYMEEDIGHSFKLITDEI